MTFCEPHRSVLYTPAVNEKAVLKGCSLPVDGLIFDLEDSVLPDEKIPARKLICRVLSENRQKFGNRKLIVRINSFDSGWGKEDLLAIATVHPTAILIPKVDSVSDLRRITNLIDLEAMKIPMWAMIETSRGVLNAQEIARDSANLEALVFGTNDLIEDIRGKISSDRKALLGSLNHIVLVSRAYELLCLDGVFNFLDDEEGFKESCLQGRELGFDGKTLIHPRQIDIANEVFSPTLAQIKEAKLKIKEFERVTLLGRGVAVFNGQIIENLHVQAAKNLLEMAKKIKNLSNTDI